MYEILYTKGYVCQIKCIQSSGGGVPQDVELCDTNLIISKKEVFKHMGLFYMYFSYPFKGLSYLDSKLLWKILRR